MSNPNTSEKSTDLNRQENITKGNVSAKKVALYVYNSDLDQLEVYSPGTTASYESRNDTTSDPNLVYLGKALPGTATSAAGWQIKRYNKSAGLMSFANAETTFNKSWDLRSTYGY